MVNPIKTFHPYNLKGVKNLNDYFFVMKNITKIIEKKGLIIKSKICYNHFLRWSNKKQKFVLDKNTSLKRDIEGIDLNNYNQFKFNFKEVFVIKHILNSITDEFEALSQKYNIKKNESRAWAIVSFISDDNIMSVNSSIIGLYKINRSSICEAIDVSDFILDSSNSIAKGFKKQEYNKSLDILNFDIFLEKALRDSIVLNIDGIEKKLDIKKLISEHSTNKFSNKKVTIKTKKYNCFDYKLYEMVFYEKMNISNKDFNDYIPSLLTLYLNISYFNFIKCSINLKENESIIVQDQKNKILYKINCCDYIKKEKDLEEKVVDNNYLYLLPKTV